jgi:uncharacterized delta-60 repeat protein
MAVQFLAQPQKVFPMRSPVSRSTLAREGGLLPIDGDIVSVLQLPDSDKKVLGINLGFEYCLAHVDGQLDLDPSFGPEGTGYLEDTFSDERFGFPAVATVALQGDKLLVIGAYFDLMESLDCLALARYDMDGQVDASFGENGKVIVDLPHSAQRRRRAGVQRAPGVQICRDPVVQADGKILFFFLEVSDEYRDGRAFLIRLTADGELDASFNAQGFVHVAFGDAEINPKGVWVQDDRKLLVYGGTQPDATGTSTALIGRFNSDGSLDDSFNGTGFVAVGTDGVVSRFTALLIDGEERIVAIGNDDDQLLMSRRLADGQPDIGFNNGSPLLVELPVAVEQLPGLQLQEGALLVAGTCEDAGEQRGLLLRLWPDGTLDPTFAEGAGMRIAERESQWLDLAIEPDGQIITAGYAHDRGYIAWIQRLGVDG